MPGPKEEEHSPGDVKTSDSVTFAPLGGGSSLIIEKKKLIQMKRQIFDWILLEQNAVVDTFE